MCGITAISRTDGKSSIPDARRFLRHAAKAIESRGKHATGFAWATDDGWPWYWKSPGAATAVAHRAPLPTGIRTAIGHTRHATQGSVHINKNNHPVLAPGITLVHNGRVHNDAEIFEAIDPDVHTRDAKVDSEAIAAMLAFPDEFGANHVSELFELVEGVAALAWLDTETPNVLHLARLAGRPMTLGRTKRGDLVMSSTPRTLTMTAHRARVRIDVTEEVKIGTYLAIEDGKIIERKRFTPQKPDTFIPEDVPGHPARIASGGGRRYIPDREFGNVIDWDNLVERRGWK